MEVKKYKIIGKGAFGEIIHPAILCKTMIIPDENEYVSKILPTNSAKKEHNIFMNLPDKLDTILYFKECSFCPFTEIPNTVITEINRLVDLDNRINKSIINIRYIRGMELNKFLTPYKNNDNQTNPWDRDNKEFYIEMQKPILLNLLLALQSFYEKVEIFNEIPFYHSDISSTNIIYNTDNNTFYLIDFGFANKVPYTFSNNPPDYLIDKMGVVDIFNNIVNTISYMKENDELMLIFTQYNKRKNDIRKLKTLENNMKLFATYQLFKYYSRELINVLTSGGKLQKKHLTHIRKSKKCKTKKCKTKKCKTKKCKKN